MAEQVETVQAVLTPTDPTFLKSRDGSGYVALVLPRDQGSAASCWDINLHDRLVEAATNGETITVTLDRRGYNKKTDAPYQNITAIEGFEPAGAATVVHKEPDTLNKTTPAQGAASRITALSGTAPRETVTKLDASDRYTKIANFGIIGRMIASGALKPEGLNGMLLAGEDYLNGEKGLKVVEGRLVTCDLGDVS